ncbi:MAG TPA: aminodeoxychorismate/anthranilate synthase component II [Bacteroidia bacterium]|nr:aminodeoxychorismate/anthranilate synthase component II [Bacteroidia bacterium]
MRILLLDNYDSFTFNLLHLVEQVEGVSVDVIRNDEVQIEKADLYDAILLSPGPGLPAEAGKMKELIGKCFFSKKMLGVCLGHQAIAEQCGAKLQNLRRVQHGISTLTTVVVNDDPVFKNIPSPFRTGHYHSWVVSRKDLPQNLRPLAFDEQGNIMAIRYVDLPVWGIQFHPESILTEYGKELIVNWLKA